jgi:hypothetical protein
VRTAGTAPLAAPGHLGSYRELVGVKTAELQKLGFPSESGPIDAGVEYRFLAEKPQFDAITGSPRT